MGDRITETHPTCTSTFLSEMSGLDPEHVSLGLLEKVHRLKTGTEMSEDLMVGRAQREQAIAWANRHEEKVRRFLEKDREE